MLRQQLIRLTTTLILSDIITRGRSFISPILFFNPHIFVVKNTIVRIHSTSNGNTNDNMVQQFTSPLLDQETTHKTALIMLNYPMQSPPSSLFTKLWAMSSGHICADGGANRLYQATKGLDDKNTEYIPDLIRGDLDSLLPDVRQYYQKLGARIELDPSQDTNDLDKALQVCNKTYSRILVFGAFGGRFDQEMASLQALYKWGSTFDNQVFLYTDETMGFLIPANVKVEIRLPYYGEDDATTTHDLEMGEGPTCGLIPLGGRVESITTSGLKWDLDGTMPLEFGGLVSTSNRMMQSIVTVESSHPVVFTAEVVRPKPKKEES